MVHLAVHSSHRLVWGEKQQSHPVRFYISIPLAPEPHPAAQRRAHRPQVAERPRPGPGGAL